MPLREMGSVDQSQVFRQRLRIETAAAQADVAVRSQVDDFRSCDPKCGVQLLLSVNDCSRIAFRHSGLARVRLRREYVARPHVCCERPNALLEFLQGADRFARRRQSGKQQKVSLRPAYDLQ